MIPKIIHYCWFGGASKSEVIEKCIASWRKYCPEWEIKEWNETNYDVKAHPFTKTAYEAKKWAFVSDVARLDILFKHGGIYLDCDVELLCEAPFSSYLGYENVMSFETERSINSGLFLAATQGSSLCDALLAPYRGVSYCREKEVVNSVMNKPVLIKELPSLKWDGKEQVIEGNCIMGIAEYGALMHHHGMRSWCDDLPSYKVSRDNKLKRILRNPKIFARMECGKILRRFVPVYEFMVYDFLDLGPVYYFKRIMMKMRNK